MKQPNSPRPAAGKTLSGRQLDCAKAGIRPPLHDECFIRPPSREENSCSAPPQMLEIPAAFSGLAEAAQMLENDLCVLIDRLQPLCAPVPPDKDHVGICPERSTELGSRLGDIEARLRRQRYLIQKTLELLQA